MQQNPNTYPKPSHPFAREVSWWFDFWTMAGRKAENQDSLVVTTCLTGYLAHQSMKHPQPQQDGQQHQPFIAPHQLPVLAVLADGVSACQFPKQASQMAVTMLTEAIVEGLELLYQQTEIIADQFAVQAYKAIFTDESVAGIIKAAVISANDAMYFSHAYHRVTPLLSTLSGVLCIGDKVHLFHTGDSRIYKVGASSLIVLSEDHRIHHGRDKGALSAALGADSRVDLQQSVFVLHQNEYLALMTDGVYEHINQVEMQFEFSAAVAHLEDTPDWSQLIQWDLSRQLCQLAYDEGSNDNLTIIMMGMGARHQPQHPQLTEPSQPSQPSKLATNTATMEKLALDDHNATDSAPLLAALAATPIEDSKAGNHDHIQIQDVNNVNSEPNAHNDNTEHDDTVKPAMNSPAPPTDAEPIIVPSIYRLPTGLEIGDEIDGFVVDKIIACTARSEVYLVHDKTGYPYVLKSPSMMTVDDGNYLRDFLKERKIGLSLSKHRRAGESAYNQTNPNHGSDTQNSRPNPGRQSRTGDNNPTTLEGSALNETGLMRYYPVPASSTYLYHLTEYIDGESLRMFMSRNGPCDVWQTHDLLTKIGMAVRVMHRNYLLHQDIKPENVLLTKSGAVKLIDFGSTGSSILKDNTRPPVGDLHYAAPEYYTDAPKGVHSDLFSIAVIGFELLTGQLPFTSQKLMSATDPLELPTDLLRQKQVPATSQQALLRALHRNTNARYQAIGEFLQDFNPDNMAFLTDPVPLIQRNPLLVWHGICLIQFIIIVFLLIKFLPIL